MGFKNQHFFSKCWVFPTPTSFTKITKVCLPEPGYRKVVASCTNWTFHNISVNFILNRFLSQQQLSGYVGCNDIKPIFSWKNIIVVVDVKPKAVTYIAIAAVATSATDVARVGSCRLDVVTNRKVLKVSQRHINLFNILLLPVFGNNWLSDIPPAPKIPSQKRENITYRIIYPICQVKPK